MWRPLLDPETSSRAWAAIERIERALETRATLATSGARRFPDLSLSSGEAGVALFLAYLDMARGGNEAGDLAFDALSHCATGLGSARLSPMLATGFAGIGWVLEHLAGRSFEADDGLSESIDEALHTLLAETTEAQPFELLGGLAGLGTYLLERSLRPAVTETLERIVTLLEWSAEESDAGIAWHTPPGWLTPERRREMPDGCYDLGVAHGIPGVVGFLAAAQHRGLDDPRVPRLLDGAVRWLLAHRLPPAAEAAFPAVLIPDRKPGQTPGQTRTPARTAWCYGDPGIAAVLLSAARALEKPDWEDEALRIARLAARRSPAATQATDPGLCHGIAGLGHLFNRLSQATGDPELAAAARAWFGRLLEPDGPGSDFADLLCWTESLPEGHSWEEEPGLLVGLSGAGLTLLAAVTPLEPAWDRVMLVSLPPAREDRPFDRHPRGVPAREAVVTP